MPALHWVLAQASGAPTLKEWTGRVAEVLQDPATPALVEELTVALSSPWLVQAGPESDLVRALGIDYWQLFSYDAALVGELYDGVRARSDFDERMAPKRERFVERLAYLREIEERGDLPEYLIPPLHELERLAVGSG